MADPDEDNEVKLVSLELNHIVLIAIIFYSKQICEEWTTILSLTKVK